MLFGATSGDGVPRQRSPCAEQYEPPGFRALDEEEAGFFARRPFAMDIGTVATQYHGVRLRVSSSLECLCLYLRTQLPTTEQVTVVMSLGTKHAI